MKILTAPVIDYGVLEDELVDAGILKREDVEEDYSYILGLLFADNWSYDCYLKLYLNDKPIPKNLDISATVYLKKCNEIYAYLREKAPGYPFILIET
jgi:hypothetical protein